MGNVFVYKFASVYVLGAQKNRHTEPLFNVTFLSSINVIKTLRVKI